MSRRKKRAPRKPVFRLADGDLVVRKFYRARVFRHTGVSSGIGKARRLEFVTDDGQAVLWETAVALQQPRLYALVRIPNVERARRRAFIIATVVAARLNRNEEE
jgi:hypothetical protein